ncbi:MAG: nitrous oxide reductase [Gammaproteobacteria bacterium]|nr:nitrous oxide reductase [Gammaproteobacteria bacterium]
MQRRTLLKTAGLAIGSAAALTTLPHPAVAALSSPGQAGPASLDNELEQHPRCIICNMDRRKFHYSRHVLYYTDQHTEGTCSINCASEAMLRERKRGFSAIYAADFGSHSDPKPLIEVTQATYLIGSSLTGVMTQVSKHSFARRSDAEAEMARSGGQLASFEQAVSSALEDYSRMLTRQYSRERQN